MKWGKEKNPLSNIEICVILDFLIPKTKTHVSQFVGLCGFYSHYIKTYAIIVTPLTDLLKGKNKKTNEESG